ncbi:hypothetical protein M3Y94_01177200 [Aphelenchoides besseyi]|nr:hypothetical protein M3Y94_01177200 [Aphelenchoides besseyi]KAI6228208.1 RFX-type winged-helix domain-containing protein [Aphelenchoides besseyi]
MTSAKIEVEDLLKKWLFECSNSQTYRTTKSPRHSRRIAPTRKLLRSKLSAKNNESKHASLTVDEDEEPSEELNFAVDRSDDQSTSCCNRSEKLTRKSRFLSNKRLSKRTIYRCRKEKGQNGEQSTQQTNERLLHQHLLQQQSQQSTESRDLNQQQANVQHRDTTFSYVPTAFSSFPLVTAEAAAVSQLRNASGYTLTQQLHQAASGANYIYESNYASPYYQHYQQQSQSPVGQSGYVHVHTQQSSPISVDDDGGTNNSLGNAARTPKATVEWLSNNYETYESASLPRCTLYKHYCAHCAENGLEAVNAASFGKLIRSVFKGLRTRRLGTRGNSKYHYHGIRIKPTSRLIHSASSDEFPHMRGTNAQPRASRRTSNHYSSNRSSSSASSSSYQKPEHSVASYGPRANGHENTNGAFDPLTIAQQEADLIRSPSEQEFDARPSQDPEPVTTEENEHQYTFGNVQLTQTSIENIGELEEVLESMGYSVQHAVEFIDQYNANCAELFEAIKSLRFDLLESIWKGFWQDRNTENQSGIPLDRMQVQRLCSISQIEKFIVRADLNLYQAVIDFLIPNIYSKTMKHVLERIRHFSRTAEIDLQQAMRNAPENIQRCKLQLVEILQYCLEQLIQINHMSDTVRKYLSTDKCMSEMRGDCGKIVGNALAAAFWVTDAERDFVMNIFEDFKRRLQHVSSLESWIQWIENILSNVMSKSAERPLADQIKAAKLFLMQWSFFTGKIVGVLTAKSSVSFAHFHLLRLLYDDYILFMVLKHLATTSNQTFISLVYEHFPISLFKIERQSSAEMDANQEFQVPNDVQYYVDQNSEIDQGMDMMCQNNSSYLHHTHDNYLNVDQPDNSIEPVLYMERENCVTTEDGASYAELRSVVEPVLSSVASTTNNENCVDSKSLISMAQL